MAVPLPPHFPRPMWGEVLSGACRVFFSRAGCEVATGQSREKSQARLHHLG